MLTALVIAGIIRIIEPLEETRKEFMIVTEEVMGSLDGWLNGDCKFQQVVFFLCRFRSQACVLQEGQVVQQCITTACSLYKLKRAPQ